MENLTLLFTVKKTHTDRYLHFESHHPTHVKRGAVRCLYDRARNITQRDESLKEEESHLMKTFIGNGYPRAFVRSAAAPRTPREPSDDDDNDTEKPPTAFLPYVAGVSERIRKVCRDFQHQNGVQVRTHPPQPTHQGKRPPPDRQTIESRL